MKKKRERKYVKTKKVNSCEMLDIHLYRFKCDFLDEVALNPIKSLTMSSTY